MSGFRSAMKPQKFWLEDLPWNQGGLGPVELGPWDFDTREVLFERGKSKGRVYSRRKLDGGPGILWWKKGYYNYNPIYGPWVVTLERAREIQKAIETKMGREFHLFHETINNSLYRHRHTEVPARLRFLPAERWCDYSPKGPLSPAVWPVGVEAVYHWQGPGKGAEGLQESIKQLNGFTHYHMFSNGWNFFAYSFVVPNVPELEPGLVLIGRGDNKRSAATGSNYGNGLPSTLIQVGVENPTPTAEMFETMDLLHQAKGWGKYSPHSNFNSTWCPGEPTRAELNRR